MWIEIAMSKPFLIPSWSRLARALWIEIGLRNRNTEKLDSRGSREPCGLKSEEALQPETDNKSRLARALWIEISAYKKSG